MRTLAKHRSLVRQVDLEIELRDLLALAEAELYRAGRELDQLFAEIEDEEREET